MFGEGGGCMCGLGTAYAYVFLCVCLRMIMCAHMRIVTNASSRKESAVCDWNACAFT